MRRFLKRIFCGALVLAIFSSAAFCGTSCGKNPQESGSEEKPRLETTEYKLVENGLSEYKIVIPASASGNIVFAASELSRFLFEATGATLAVVTDETEVSGPVISIGDTSAAKKLAVSASSGEELGYSGYKIETVGDSVAILSDPDGNGEGCLYGVYDFLYDAVGFKVYAADEIVYTRADTVPLYEYDVTVKPSFDVRSIGYSSLMNDKDYLRRMRLMDHYSDERWGIFGHSQVSDLLPTSVYGKEHPDWYNSSMTQLCWSAGDAMETEVANNLIAYIEAKPEAEYFMLGQEDIQSYCNCNKCLENRAKYGSYAGLQTVFVNHVIEKAEAWRKENAPKRDIKYVIFAYQSTLDAPVKKDENGNCAAYHPDVVPNEKLYVYFTPIETTYSYTLEDEKNSRISEALEGWASIMDPAKILVYTYDINFYNYFVNFNNFTSFHAQLRTYYDAGIRYMYSQGPLWSIVPSFQEMRIFVESQLMWNVEKSYDELVDEFMAAYFRDGAAAMRKYYDITCMRYIEYQTTTGNDVGGIYSAIGTSEIWTEAIVSKLGDCIDEALAAVEPIRESDPSLYETLRNRIKKESLNVLYLKLTHYQPSYSEYEVEKMKTEFKYYTGYFGMNANRENGTLDGLFD